MDIFSRLYVVLRESNAEELWVTEIETYLNSGGDINVVDQTTGWGLLHLAAENLFLQVVQLLFDQGADMEITDTNGWTAYLVALDSSIDSAIQHGEEEIDFSVVKFLIDHGADWKLSTEAGVSTVSLLDNYGERARKEFQAMMSA